MSKKSPSQELQSQQGQLRYINHFAGHLEQTLDVSQIRYGSSLVSRCEASLLGISSPRFVFRLNVGSGFISIRRKTEISKSTKTISSDPLVSNWKKNCPHLADCVLSPPNNLQQRYSVLNVDLSAHYGEKSAVGVPFIQTYTFGGGVCTQAAIWMTACCLIEEAETVDGPGDISYVSKFGRHYPDKFVPTGKIGISGMNSTQIRNYLEDIGLNSGLHCVRADYSDYASDDDVTIDERAQEIHFFVEAYIKSGFPLISYCDLGRLAARSVSAPKMSTECSITSVYADNDLHQALAPIVSVSKRQDHTIVIVGTGMSESGQQCVLANDSSSVPFLEIPIEKLLRSRRYRSNAEHLIENSLEASANFQPVLPGPVKLYCYENYKDGVKISGLGVYYDKVRDTPFFMKSNARQGEGSSFQNTKIRLVGGRTDWKPHDCTVIDSFLDELEINGSENKHFLAKAIAKSGCEYVWLQAVPTTEQSRYLILVWDATSEPYGTHELEPKKVYEAQVASVELGKPSGTDDLSLEIPESKNSEESVSVQSPQTQDYKCKPRILSSAFPFDWATSLGRIRNELIAREDCSLSEGDLLPIELYCAMCSEIPSSSSHLTAVEFLANFTEPDFDAFIDATLLAAKSNQLQVDGLASFVPEISACDSKARETGVRALAGLQKVVSKLRAAGHPANYIEIVGGTTGKKAVRLQGDNIPNDLDSLNEACWVFEFDSRQNKIKLLLDSLVKTSTIGGNNVPWLLEIEPSNLFVANSPRVAKDIIDNAQAKQLEVYLNLDLAHVDLCGDSAYEFFLETPLAKQARNFHVSGMSKAHFADLTFKAFNPKQLKLLRRALAENPSLADNDGAVSMTLEIECASDSDIVVDSFVNLENTYF